MSERVKIIARRRSYLSLCIKGTLFQKLVHFKQVVEAVMEKSIDEEEYLSLVLERGVVSMLTDLLGSQDATTLLKSIEQMADRNPAFVYDYIADVLRLGAGADRETAKRRLGFIKD